MCREGLNMVRHPNEQSEPTGFIFLFLSGYIRNSMLTAQGSELS